MRPRPGRRVLGKVPQQKHSPARDRACTLTQRQAPHTHTHARTRTVAHSSSRQTRGHLKRPHSSGSAETLESVPQGGHGFTRSPPSLAWPVPVPPPGRGSSVIAPLGPSHVCTVPGTELTLSKYRPDERDLRMSPDPRGHPGNRRIWYEQPRAPTQPLSPMWSPAGDQTGDPTPRVVCFLLFKGMGCAPPREPAEGRGLMHSPDPTEGRHLGPRTPCDQTQPLPRPWSRAQPQRGSLQFSFSPCMTCVQDTTNVPRMQCRPRSPGRGRFPSRVA